MGMDPEVTQLLQRVENDPAAADSLFRAVYDDLLIIARARMASERPGHTLQATALVSEAYLRLLGGAEIRFNDRKHFYRVAAEAMRRILIDHARARAAQKRDGGGLRFQLAEGDARTEIEPERLLALDDALAVLEREDPRAAEIARLRFFAGMDLATITDMLEISERTANRDWKFARARLAELLADH